jgi:hypothetical protein
MAVRLRIGVFKKLEGTAMEDFELLTVGQISTIPQVIGDAGCLLGEGTFSSRIPGIFQD